MIGVLIIVFCTYCSDDKDRSHEELPAIQRYRSNRIQSVYNAAMSLGFKFLILSGEYGILEASDPIPYYDHLLQSSEVSEHTKRVADQMEAQNEDEAKKYIKYLKIALDFVVEEVKSHRNFEKELQLFQLFRLVSPKTHAKHPNQYRNSIVQIGSYVCPDQSKVPRLMADLFYRMKSISNPIIKAIYFHHELIRIHPFLDGNGRITRIAKNWMLMYELYPPIFIKDISKKKEYITALGNSFRELNNTPNEWNKYTSQFFEQELDRLLINAKDLYDAVHQRGIYRREKGKNK